MTYVWRLRIEYPETPNEAEVERWREEHRTFEGQGGWDTPEWRWPRERLFLSAGGAESRRRLLERLGATATIERSEPVTWGDR